MLEHKLFRGSLYLKLTGELDHAVAPPLKSRIDAILNSNAYERVIIDMSGLSFMDSTGVGLIMGRYKLLKSKNKLLSIRAPSPQADKVLQVSGIYTIIPKIQ
ncbi:MAG: anti-sigma factor antagonist [Clostridia bacterium]